MLKCFEKIDWKKTGIFAGGVIIWTAGIKVLSSKDAKKDLHKLYRSFLKSKRVCDDTVSTVQEMPETSMQAQRRSMRSAQPRLRQRHLQMQRQKQQRRPRLQRTPKNKILIRGE